MADLPIEEFQGFGYLQEVNRRVLHPVGLALQVAKIPDGEPARRAIALTDESIDYLRQLADWAVEAGKMTEEWRTELNARISEVEPQRFWLDSVHDCRDDPEGIVFEGETQERRERAARFQAEWDQRVAARQQALGYVVQPIP